MTQSTALSPRTSPALLDAMKSSDVDAIYRPFLQTKEQHTEGKDWVQELELDLITNMMKTSGQRLKILVLYGSMRGVSSYMTNSMQHVRVATS